MIRQSLMMRKRAICQAALCALAGTSLFAACGDDDDDAANGSSTGGSGGTTAQTTTRTTSNTTGANTTTTGGGGASAGAGGLAGSGGEAGSSAVADPCRGTPLPEDQHFVPEGMCASAVAMDQGSLRQISFASNGDLIGVRTSGEIMRYRDVNDDGAFSGSDEVVQIADTGGNGNNAHLDEENGYLYAGTADGVRRWAYSAQDDDLGEGQDVVVGQPSSGTHTYHTTHLYGDWLYVHSGSEDNLVFGAEPAQYDTERSVLKRFDVSSFDPEAPFDWSDDGEVFVLGIRNMVGYTQNSTGEMYGVVNGADNIMYGGEDVHLDNPGERLILLEEGSSHGYPFCFTAQHIETDAGIVAAGTQLATEADGFTNPHDDEWCAANATEPLTFLTAHSAPLDINFYETFTGALPKAWLGAAFVSQHGSWNTMPSVGHRVVAVPFEGGAPEMPVATEAGTEFPFEVVFGGGAEGSHDNGTWGWDDGEVGEDPVRPVGVAISPVDGALYVSSDGEGVIYRIGVRQ